MEFFFLQSLWEPWFILPRGKVKRIEMMKRTFFTVVAVKKPLCCIGQVVLSMKPLT